MKLWAFNDSHDWGTQLARAAQARGHDAHLFENPREPDTGNVFMHMHHQPQVRLLHKRCMAIMAMRPELNLIPSYRASCLFDDKLEQARQLARWMPRTHVFYSPGAAKRWLDRGMTIPFVSKSSEGENSHNVRIIANLEDAYKEVRYAFSDIGIKCRHQQTQRGYLLWQSHVDSEAEYRVIAVGRQRLILRREGGDDRSVAQGQGQLRPVLRLDVDDHTVELYALANRFFTEEGIKWGAVDMVRGPDGGWFVTGFTVRWTMHHYYECPFLFDEQKRCGNDIWNVLLDEIEAGAI